ncbi:unnamed protein product [Boreogadus saida]
MESGWIGPPEPPWPPFTLSCPATPVKKRAERPSLGDLRANSITEELDFVGEDLPRQGMSDICQALTTPFPPPSNTLHPLYRPVHLIPPNTGPSF